MDLPVLQSRACGSCSICCVAPEVEALGKPDWEPCSRLTTDGCVDYTGRPDDCRRYRCGWLQGQGLEEHRPDRVGVLFSALELQPVGLHFVVHEMKPGALEGEWVQGEVLRLATHRLVFRVLEDGARQLLCGPRQQVRALEAMEVH